MATDSKLLWGCLGTVAVLCVAAGVAYYQFLFRPMMKSAPDILQIGTLADMNAGIAMRRDFQPPADNLLTAGQVRAFARVEAAIRDSLGQDRDLLRRRTEKLSDKDLGAMLLEARGFLQGMGPILVRAKTAQVAALNRDSLSLGEYRWIRESVFRALGVRVSSTYIEDVMSRGHRSYRVSYTNEPSSEPAVPEENALLVHAWRDSAKVLFPLAALGF
jgi:hypothetical protein